MDNLFQGIGVFICVGGILLALLAVFAGRRAFGSRTTPRRDRYEDENVWQERGREAPRYDTDEVRSRGGFGSAPGAGNVRRERQTDDFDRFDNDRETGLGTGPGGGDRLQDYRRRRDQDDDDEDNVRSSGGFGG